MKLITLNLWGGFLHPPLMEFVKTHQDIDLFCFQEVYHNAPHKISTDQKPLRLRLFSELQHLLSHHVGFFRPVVQGIYGLALFIKKSFEPFSEGEIPIYTNPSYKGTGPTHSRILQWLTFQDHHILNVHGLWNGQGKGDTPERMLQSQKILEFMNTLHGPKILCGDFNLRPETQSLELLRPHMTDLIQTHKITSTRTSFYPKDEPYADYIFTSSDLKVLDFQKLSHEVSDHAPLYLEYSL